MIRLPINFLINKDAWDIFIGNEKNDYWSICYSDLLFFWSEVLARYNPEHKSSCFKVMIHLKDIKHKLFIKKLEKHIAVKNINYLSKFVEVDIDLICFKKFNNGVFSEKIDIDINKITGCYETISNLYADIIKNSSYNDGFVINLYTLCKILNYTTDSPILSIETNMEKVFKKNRVYPYFDHELGENVESINVMFFSSYQKKYDYHNKLKILESKTINDNIGDISIDDLGAFIDSVSDLDTEFEFEDEAIDLDDVDLDDVDFDFDDVDLDDDDLDDDEIAIYKTEISMLKKNIEELTKINVNSSNLLALENDNNDSLIKERNDLFEEIIELNNIISFYKKHYDKQFKV